MSNDDQESGAAAPAAGNAPVEELQNEIERWRGEADRYRDEALRARAEVDNIRKRATRDVEAAHKYGLERLVEALLPVKDSLDLGCDAAITTTDLKSLQDGMVLTAQLFDGALTKIGISTVAPVGDKFDPELHQAVMMEPSSASQPGTVLRVLQKGYLLNERLIRPAMVVVAKVAD